jgi:hypothetical protein
MIKGVIIFSTFMIFLSSFILAGSVNIEFPLGDNFKAGENITVKVSIFDDKNNPINGNVELILIDAEKKNKIQKTIPSKEIVEFSLGSNALHGFWTIEARYQDAKISKQFTIEAEELARFEINGDLLTITNIGNTKYTKTVQILIGDTVGTKEPEIKVGESISFRLIAPKGNYEVKITDGQSSIQRTGVSLTGNVVGILDERIEGGNTLTGGIRPEEGNSLSYLKGNKFVYVFILMIFGATILLAIERTYRKRSKV